MCIFFAVGAAFFSKTTNDLVVEPVELMISKVQSIIEDPLKAVENEEKRAVEKEKEDQKKLRELGD